MIKMSQHQAALSRSSELIQQLDEGNAVRTARDSNHDHQSLPAGCRPAGLQCRQQLLFKVRRLNGHDVRCYPPPARPEDDQLKYRSSLVTYCTVSRGQCPLAAEAIEAIMA